MNPDPTKGPVTTAPAEQPDPTRNLCAWVKLYHPSAALVTLPVVAPGLDPHELLDCVSRLVEAGWLVTAPGLEEGEQKFDCEAVVRRSKGNQDGTETPVVDLYEHGNEYRSLAVYLNTEDEERAFEQASGLSLSKCSAYPGQAPIQRGVSRQTDLFVAVAPRPFSVVCKANPKYDPNETDAKKKKPKRVFVRWGGQAAARPAAESGELTAGMAVRLCGLMARCREAGRPVDVPRWLAWLGAESIETIRRADFDKAAADLAHKLREAPK